jgi:Fe2+ or Zn2+ uptake regulation protein
MAAQNTTDQLKAQGFRLTPQRLAILRILEEAGGHVSPADVYQQASRQMPGITEATVYRTLEFLSQQGLALVANTQSGHLVYEEASRDHHHLVCRKCGRAVEIDHDRLKALYRQFQEDTGFRVDSSHLVFFGECPDCIPQG